jgi:hypothetical protein
MNGNNLSSGWNKFSGRLFYYRLFIAQTFVRQPFQQFSVAFPEPFSIHLFVPFSDPLPKIKMKSGRLQGHTWFEV